MLSRARASLKIPSSLPSTYRTLTKKTSNLGGALIIGAGPGLGKSLVKRFKLSGYITGASRRTVGGLDFLSSSLDRAYDGYDARNEEHVKAMFSDFDEACEGNIQVVVFNIGANIKFPILETTKRKFEKCWEMACLSGFLVGKEGERSKLFIMKTSYQRASLKRG